MSIFINKENRFFGSNSPKYKYEEGDIYIDDRLTDILCGAVEGSKSIFDWYDNKTHEFILKGEKKQNDDCKFIGEL